MGIAGPVLLRQGQQNLFVGYRVKKTVPKPQKKAEILTGKGKVLGTKGTWLTTETG